MRKNQKQQDFFGVKKATSHGGDLALGRRKNRRPLDRKKPVHIVLKSTHAKGKMSFLTPKNRLLVEATLRKVARVNGATIMSLQIMGNHIHLLVKFHSRALFQKFLRVSTGLIARLVTGARKGKAFGKRFWDKLRSLV